MRRERESGQLMIIVALGMVVFLGFAALALDLGQGYSKRRLAQNGADAAALAGMRLVRQQANAATPMTGAQIYQVIKQVADLNGNAEQLPAIPTGDEAVFLDANKVPLTGGNVYTWVNPDFGSVYGLRVNTRIMYPTLFAGIFGYSQMASGGVATAMSFGVDDTALLPMGVKTYAQCGAPFGFDNPPTTDTSYYNVSNGWGWKFFTNDPGVPGGVGWVSLDGSNASAEDMGRWVVEGFKPGINAAAAGFKWWTNYDWFNSIHPSGPDFGGWGWDSAASWYEETIPSPDSGACDGYYTDGGGFDWTDPGPLPPAKKGPATWGSPAPNMPSGTEVYNLKDAPSMHPPAATATATDTLIGRPIIWMKQRTGVGGSDDIKDAISDMVGHDVMVLVYNRTDGTGATAKLQIIGILAFNITNVEWNGANTGIWGLYKGAVVPGTPTTTPNAGMVTTVRLVAN